MTPFRLTPEQEEVVALREGSYLVLAPPGAGKTEVIAQRVVRLLADSRGEDYRILALTYNNRAAASMRRRVREHLDDLSWRATIETYHAFYLDVLRHYGSAIGIPPEVTVYDTVDARLQALAQGLEEDGFLIDELDRDAATQILDGISRLNRSLIPPSGAPDKGVEGISIRDAYTAYDAVLRRNGAVDFDTMLTRAYELLTDHPQVARHYRRIYRFILVDEGQDTSSVQFELLRALCGDEHRNVFMVADPDQLINQWLGADRKNLDRFLTDFHATQYQLTTNFRCADDIVEIANHLLEADSRTVRKVVTPSANASGWVGAWSFATEEDEAAAIVDWITSLRDGGLHEEWLAPGESADVAPDEIAILARSRMQLGRVMAELDTRNEAFMFRAGESGPFDTSFYRTLLDCLRVLANPRDIAMRRTLLAEMPDTIDLAAGELENLSGLEPEEFLSKVAERDSSSLGEPIEHLAVAATMADGLQALLEPSKEELTGSDTAELLEADRELLIERLHKYRLSVESSSWTWSGVVMALVAEPRDDPTGLRVSTVHAAKGLEFRVVVVVGFNDGSFPDFRSLSSAAEEASERRLAYVAVTRAARALLLSRPRSRVTRSGPMPQRESRFVQLMGLSMQPK